MPSGHLAQETPKADKRKRLGHSFDFQAPRNEADSQIDNSPIALCLRLCFLQPTKQKPFRISQMKLTLAGLSRFDFIGVFLLRLGAGALVTYHGFPMLLGGTEAWTEIGSGAAIAHLPETFYLAAGLASCCIQVFGGLLLALGLFSRGSALLLTVVSGFALANVIQSGDFHLTFFAHLQVSFVFLALMFIGPGRFSLDRRGI